MLQIRKECTGCMACVNICPSDALLISMDSYGYIMPEVDAHRCIECGQCEEVCPIEREPEPTPVPKKAFSAYHRSEEVVQMSSSGGAFYALAEEVLRQDGIVFGCYYDLEKKEARLEDTDHLPLEALLTSKYVESRIGLRFRDVRRELESGRFVLFCSTPCQTAGLKSYLGRDYENLLLTDFACGAVSSEEYLRSYLLELEERAGAEASRMTFRDKRYGWGQYSFLVRFKNGKTYQKTAMSDPYFFCFLRSSMQRLSCHGCRFSAAHASDLCLSDFWKCDHFAVDRNDRRGLSLILAMTEKGEKAVQQISGKMNLQELDPEQASYHLKKRHCPESKLPEIEGDMRMAKEKGVRALRKQLLSPKQRAFYALRQWTMDHPALSAILPDLAGDGQIVKTGK